MKLNQSVKKLVAGATVAAMSVSAYADGISDATTGIVAEIGKIPAVIVAVGTALLGVHVIRKAFSLVAGFLGGR